MTTGMIAINVLPQDMRRVTQTPAARLATIFAGVGVLVAGAAFLANHYMGMVRTLEATNASLAEEAQKKKNLVKLYGYDELMRDIQTFDARKKVVASIWQSRLKWAPKLDELIDVVPKYVGLQSLELSRPAPGTKAPKGKAYGSKLVMKCISDGTQLERYEEFVRILKGEPSQDLELSKAGAKFFKDFREIVDLGARPTRDTSLPQGLDFTLELYLKDKKDAKAQTPVPDEG